MTEYPNSFHDLHRYRREGSSHEKLARALGNKHFREVVEDRDPQFLQDFKPIQIIYDTYTQFQKIMTDDALSNNENGSKINQIQKQSDMLAKFLKLNDKQLAENQVALLEIERSFVGAESKKIKQAVQTLLNRAKANSDTNWIQELSSVVTCDPSNYVLRPLIQALIHIKNGENLEGEIPKLLNAAASIKYFWYEQNDYHKKTYGVRAATIFQSHIVRILNEPQNKSTVVSTLLDCLNNDKLLSYYPVLHILNTIDLPQDNTELIHRILDTINDVLGPKHLGFIKLEKPSLNEFTSEIGMLGFKGRGGQTLDSLAYHLLARLLEKDDIDRLLHGDAESCFRALSIIKRLYRHKRDFDADDFEDSIKRLYVKTMNNIVAAAKTALKKVKPYAKDGLIRNKRPIPSSTNEQYEKIQTTYTSWSEFIEMLDLLILEAKYVGIGLKKSDITFQGVLEPFNHPALQHESKAKAYMLETFLKDSTFAGMEIRDSCGLDSVVPSAEIS